MGDGRSEGAAGKVASLATQAFLAELASLAPPRVALPKDSLQISIDHFVATKARGSDAAIKRQVDDAFKGWTRVGGVDII